MPDTAHTNTNTNTTANANANANTGVTPRPLPVEDDPDSAGFWAATRRGDLAIRTCDTCGTTLHAPVAFCAACGGWESSWHTVAPTGTVYSWTVVEHQTHPAFPVPYTIVLVQLDDVPARLVGRLDGRVELHAGQRINGRLEAHESGTVLVQWEPATA